MRTNLVHGIALAAVMTLLFVSASAPVTAGVVCGETVYNVNLIRAVQRKLRESTMSTLVVDGKWSHGTIKALEKYQQSHKMTPSGVLDEATFKAMFGSERKYEPFSQSRCSFAPSVRPLDFVPALILDVAGVAIQVDDIQCGRCIDVVGEDADERIVISPTPMPDRGWERKTVYASGDQIQPRNAGR